MEVPPSRADKTQRRTGRTRPGDQTEKNMSKDVNKCVFHYTTGRCLAGILSDGYVAPSTIGVPSRERAASWWTSSETFEPTAAKMGVTALGTKVLTVDEMMKLDGGVFRVAVLASSIPLIWRSWLRTSGVKGKAAAALKAYAARKGSRIELWKATFDPVPAAMWVAVDQWNGADWVPVEHVKVGPKELPAERPTAIASSDFA